MEQSPRHILNLKRISVGYPPEKRLLDNITTSVPEGELIAIMGRNGSGKSTLMRTIGGLAKPLKGEVVVAGKEIGQYPRQKLAKLLTYVGASMQSPGNLTVFEMVSLGRHPYTNWWGSLKNSDEAVVYESLKFVGMEQFAQKRMHTLSDGERQRVLTAMALAQDASVILLDEPTAFLDIPNRLEVINVLFELKKSGKTVIFSTHDFENVLQFADKVWLLHDQQLLEGAPEDLGMHELYDKVFHESGIAFDPETMQFKKTTAGNQFIVFDEGESIAARWTRKMLQRAGYRVKNSGGSQESLPVLKMIAAGKGFQWELTRHNATSNFDSLYKLASYLTRE